MRHNTDIYAMKWQPENKNLNRNALNVVTKNLIWDTYYESTIYKSKSPLFHELNIFKKINKAMKILIQQYYRYTFTNLIGTNPCTQMAIYVFKKL